MLLQCVDFSLLMVRFNPDSRRLLMGFPLFASPPGCHLRSGLLNHPKPREGTQALSRLAERPPYAAAILSAASLEGAFPVVHKRDAVQKCEGAFQSCPAVSISTGRSNRRRHYHQGPGRL